MYAGEIRVADQDALDFESPTNRITFDVMASDGGGMSTQTSVTVAITNTNDNRPEFRMNSYTANVVEVREQRRD